MLSCLWPRGNTAARFSIRHWRLHGCLVGWRAADYPSFMTVNKNTFVIGFMLFAIFFGAGNLIFPSALGLESGQTF